MDKVTEILCREISRLEQVERNYAVVCDLLTRPIVSTGENYHDVASRLNEVIKLIKELAPKH